MKIFLDVYLSQSRSAPLDTARRSLSLTPLNSTSSMGRTGRADNYVSTGRSVNYDKCSKSTLIKGVPLTLIPHFQVQLELIAIIRLSLVAISESHPSYCLLVMT
jgi:hypothetical protein